MKKKGFTLIELVVVVAIILLLAATLAPKLRKEVAKARDAKAVAVLGAIRTATSVYVADQGVVPYLYVAATTGDGIVLEDASGELTSEYVETSVVSFLDEVGTGTTPAEALTANNRLTTIPIGGHQLVSGTVSYGGRIALTGNTDGDFNLAVASGDSTVIGTVDTKGNTWAKY
jgi:prepilin-type N-terminal cleavage/methylation domain-containing protein